MYIKCACVGNIVGETNHLYGSEIRCRIRLYIYIISPRIPSYIYYIYAYTKSLPLGFPHPTVKYVGEPLGRPYLIGIVSRRRVRRGDRRRTGSDHCSTAGSVFGRRRVGGGRGTLVMMILWLGPGQRRPAATASRIPPSSVAVVLLATDVPVSVVLERILFADTTLFATNDGRPCAATFNWVPIPGQRLVGFALIPRRIRVPGRMLVFAVRRRRSARYRVRSRLDHGNLTGLAVPTTAARLVRRFSTATATATILVLLMVMLQMVVIVVVVVQMVVMVIRRGYRQCRRASRQRNLR